MSHRNGSPKLLLVGFFASSKERRSLQSLLLQIKYRPVQARLVHCYFHLLGGSTSHNALRLELFAATDADHSCYVIFCLQTVRVCYCGVVECTSHGSKAKKLHMCFFNMLNLTRKEPFFFLNSAKGSNFQKHLV